MPKVSKRAIERTDISSTLKVCPFCLGDVEFRGADGSDHYVCLQCGARDNPHDRAARQVHAPRSFRTSRYLTTDALLNRVPF